MSHEKSNSAIPAIQKYYGSMESRLGYRLFLGGARHYGYYEGPHSSPFDVNNALRAMEAKMLEALQLPPKSRVLDAGCGDGYVAIYMARSGGLRVEAIDVVPHHLANAKRNVKKSHLAGLVNVQLGDYHHLESFEDGSLDGIYHMETFTHSTSPRDVLQSYLRILRPGGRLVLHEYDHAGYDKMPADVADKLRAIEKHTAMVSHHMFSRDALPTLLQEAGFEDVMQKDFSEHVVPMQKLFYMFAVVPYFFVRAFKLQRWLPNTMAGVESYRSRRYWQYVQVTGRKAL